MTTRFTVEKTFDLPSRDGILVTGSLLQGSLVGGETLLVETTNTRIQVLGVEFLTPKQRATNQLTIRVSRQDAAKIAPGAMLTS